MKLMKRDSQRGSAMLVTLIITVALLAGAAVLVSLQLSANKSTELSRAGIAPAGGRTGVEQGPAGPQPRTWSRAVWAVDHRSPQRRRR